MGVNGDWGGIRCGFQNGDRFPSRELVTLGLGWSLWSRGLAVSGGIMSIVWMITPSQPSHGTRRPIKYLPHWEKNTHTKQGFTHKTLKQNNHKHTHPCAHPDTCTANTHRGPVITEPFITVDSQAWFWANGYYHTHSWHSVEIFNSLVLPRKTLTRAPKFPVLGLFSTGRAERRREVKSRGLYW